MKDAEIPSVGVRRDGSFYTRVLWADVTENDPCFWVNNIINDDLCRNGGTWGANSDTTANCVLDFFGETVEIGEVAIYKNVGLDISILEELTKNVNIYVCENDSPLKLRRKEDKVDAAEWTQVCRFDVVKEQGWQKIVLEKPVAAKYIRMEMIDNFCARDDKFIPWIEMNEIKLYPPKKTC